jgi:Tfp pilus assembly protein PilX
MDLHWVAGVAVLLILVAISAYREALDSDRTIRIGALKRDRTMPHEADQAMERV